MSKCKNCGHVVLKINSTLVNWCVHVSPKSRRFDVECDCGCIKPEPEKAEVQGK